MLYSSRHRKETLNWYYNLSLWSLFFLSERNVDQQAVIVHSLIIIIYGRSCLYWQINKESDFRSIQLFLYIASVFEHASVVSLLPQIFTTVCKIQPHITNSSYNISYMYLEWVLATEIISEQLSMVTYVLQVVVLHPLFDYCFGCFLNRTGCVENDSIHLNEVSLVAREKLQTPVNNLDTEIQLYHYSITL